MASELKVDKFTGVTTAGSILVTGEGNSTTTNLQQGLCKFWTQTDGTGTVSNRDSFNSSALTDNGTGDYTHTFTNAMSNNDYSSVGMAAGSNHSAFYNEDNTLTTSFRQLIRASGTDNDTDPLALQICGDLA
tara:strand:+ start:178 stop:573 length:396 start_codon:yes stop_codon:yes gene_type:complete